MKRRSASPDISLLSYRERPYGLANWRGLLAIGLTGGHSAPSFSNTGISLGRLTGLLGRFNSDSRPWIGDFFPIIISTAVYCFRG